MNKKEDDFHMIQQPFLTDDGFVNEACMNELTKALANAPTIAERFKDDPFWNDPRWVTLKCIAAHFSSSVMVCCRPGEFLIPTDLVEVTNYLIACFKHEFDWKTEDDDGIYLAELTLYQVMSFTYKVLMDHKQYLAWNSREVLKEGWISLEAVFQNMACAFRWQWEREDKFDEEFEKE